MASDFKTPEEIIAQAKRKARPYFFAGAALTILSILAMITHIGVCIKTSAWILLLFGLFFAPVGIIHGIGIWLGIF